MSHSLSLVKACNEFVRWEDELERLCAQDDVKMKRAVRNELYAKLRSAEDCQSALIGNIARTPATTRAQLRAKARALEAFVIKDREGRPAQSDDLLAYSLAQDLLRYT